ncbi:hypothetical protein JBL43_16835 [Aureibaculum sp. A20]|uniref:DUF1593 domain-containing protein n=1 Tax=Aureibaculum flavum TaxID=2795986 RepID=A0ABS0WVQ0_9FLAO|nr:hypothetical protein [Aureibaculum flavum]MBJ2175923.1 hypothetical protein [Aureibaculum flavum]
MFNKPRYILSVLILNFIPFANVFGQTIPYTTGRIVISSDGNEHDHDDWAATPLSLALLSARNLQDSLTVYTFSDHIWGSNHEKSDGKKQMLISALEGKEIYHFKNSNFIEAVSDSTKAIEAITNEINKSSKNSPLTIVAAGPMHVVGSGLNNAMESKLKYVRIISHSNWNNRNSDKPYTKWESHSGWTWNEIREKFESKGLIVDRIKDQNGGDGYVGLKAPKHLYDWMKTLSIRETSEELKNQLDWLYDRQLTCIKKGDFDPSDAGMIIYLLTGKQKTNPDMAKKIIENQTK